MNINVGSIDRLVRVMVGIAMLSAIFWVEGSARWFGLIGLVPLLTAAVGFCPLYTMLGVSTCGAGHNKGA